MLSLFSHVRLYATLGTVASKAPLSMRFSRQEYWSGITLLQGNLPNPGMEPVSLTSPALAGRFFTTSATWEAPQKLYNYYLNFITVVCGLKLLLSSSFQSEKARTCRYCFHTFSASL